MVFSKLYLPVWATQQTRTRDFTCSVSEFTSSTGSIHVNSPDSVDKCCVSIRVSLEITIFFTWSNSFKTRDNRQNTCIHVNTRENTYWWSGTNYEPVWHLPTGSEMVPCLLGNERKLKEIPSRQFLIKLFWNNHVWCYKQVLTSKKELVSVVNIYIYNFQFHLKQL